MKGPLTGGAYEIVVGVALDTDWSDWFAGFEVRVEGERTRLTGTVADQAALHGVIARLRDLGIPILDVHRMPGDTAHEQVEDRRGNTPPGT